jgi:hypothetical protein
VGLDCEHSCATELHPVYAMAIHVNDSPSDDVWAIFVRNWGNEGYCSQDQHYLDVNAFTFRLPWRPGATSVVVKTATFQTNDARVSGPAVAPASNQGVLVTFTLPAPEAGARVNGELHLQWTGGQAAAMHAIAAPPAVTAPGPEAGKSTEERLEDLHRGMTTTQRQLLTSRLAIPVTHDSIAPRATAVTAPGAARPAPGLPKVRAVHDARKAKKDEQRRAALCEAHGGNIPGLPNACTAAHQ